MARILIVDEAAFMRMMLTDIRTKGGFEIAGEAADGNEAVSYTHLDVYKRQDYICSLLSPEYVRLFPPKNQYV